MKKTKVISAKSIYWGMPLNSTILAYLLLDKFNASGVVWGIVGTLYSIIWVLWIFSLFVTDYIDIFEQTNLKVDE